MIAARRLDHAERVISTFAALVDPIDPHPLHCASGETTDASVQLPLRPAAVLFALSIQHGAIDLVLTVRNAALRSHPGQISFPGGRVERGDRDAAVTATREAFEEIGVNPTDVRVIGALDPCYTGTGFSVVPILGLIPAAYAYRLDPGEVAEIFHVPLSYALDPARHQRLHREFNGQRREYFAIDYGARHIWGATARMIVDFSNRLRAHPDAAAVQSLFADCDKN